MDELLYFWDKPTFHDIVCCRLCGLTHGLFILFTTGNFPELAVCVPNFDSIVVKEDFSFSVRLECILICSDLFCVHNRAEHANALERMCVLLLLSQVFCFC